MSKPSFACVMYIHATAEDVWKGLVDPEFTSRYWMHEFISDWKPGSEWIQQRTDTKEETVSVVGKVLEIDPPNRLVLSWVPPNDAEDLAKISKVSFELASQDDWPHGPWTGLHVVHSELEPDSDMLHSITFGWPALLSGLKSVIESPEIFVSE